MPDWGRKGTMETLEKSFEQGTKVARRQVTPIETRWMRKGAHLVGVLTVCCCGRVLGFRFLVFGLVGLGSPLC